ncbi:hypothetical protein DPMN_022719 [Dreissena polymorpha]|uniref:Uncharacterized protein n=1 Tax=Dreissena polymorpha TaxID=45954 RepID=A0A9D4SB04_DREPO|nr:hypothetical protein DPMN_022719 [Dreissena polymorpha]
MSDDVRRNLYLRSQRPSDPGGLWGLKKPVGMLLADKQEMVIDWIEFDAVDRHARQKKSVASLSVLTFLFKTA